MAPDKRRAEEGEEEREVKKLREEESNELEDDENERNEVYSENENQANDEKDADSNNDEDEREQDDQKTIKKKSTSNDDILAEEEEEDKSNMTRFLFRDEEYRYKERPGAIEEREGKIEFRVVNNDNSKESMMILTGLKNIFQKQLPKMPREYISRLVYDRSHISLAVVRKPMTVVGGITFRPFESHEFAEIVFCAISSAEQVRGYGAHMMNHLKDYVKATSKVMHFLTYADNYAIGYFKKQGFTKEITLDKKLWMGYIKDYEGGTMMQCSMLPRVRYLDALKILLIQKSAILKKIRTISQSHVVRPGIEAFRDPDTKEIDPMTIPGLKEAGWTPIMDELARRPKRGPHFAMMQHLLSEMENHPSAWPFAHPVNKEEVPDYYEVIKEPMDLSTMEQKLEADVYQNLETFIHDARLIFNNCRSYNNESTTYYKNATKLEKFLYQKVREVPEYSHLVE